MIIIPDNEIIDSVLAGNYRDYSILVERYKTKAYSLIRRMLKNDMDAQEVLQDSFLKAYSNLRSFRRDSKFSTWFYRISYNTALNKLKGRAVDAMRISVEETDLVYEDFKNDPDTKSRAGLLNELLESLNPQYSAALNLFYFEEASCEEIGQIMQIEPNYVKVLLHRARKALVALIEKKGLKEEFI